jgi:hypothetical protein
MWHDDKTEHGIAHDSSRWVEQDLFPDYVTHWLKLEKLQMVAESLNREANTSGASERFTSPAFAACALACSPSGRHHSSPAVSPPGGNHQKRTRL